LCYFEDCEIEKSSKIHVEDSEFVEEEALISVVDSQVTPLYEPLIEELRHPEFVSEESESTQESDSDVVCSVVMTVDVFSINQPSLDKPTVNDDIDCDTTVMPTRQLAISNAVAIES